jgi:ribonuclease P protein subunit POP4
MTVTPKNVLRHEIIGLSAEIVESSHPSLQGISGTIVFETRNTILIRKDSLIRQAPKNAVKKMRLQTYCGACFIRGPALIGRPEDRLSRLDNQ